MACISARAEVINRIAAVVGSEVITERELNRAVALRERGVTPEKKEALRQETLNKMIDDLLLNQIMSKSKIEVSDDDLARAVANVLYRNHMSIDQLKAEVASKGMTYDEYKKQLEKDIRRVKFVNQVIGPQVKITDQDLRDYYQRNQEKFRGGVSAHIAEIVLPGEGIQTQAEFDKLGELAVSIVSKARSGSDFASLAKQYSKGPNAEKGGDMGFVNLKDMPTEIADVVKNMKVGDVSNPALTSTSIVIVKLISLPEISPGDFEKLRDDIYSALYEQKIEEALDNYLLKERQRAFVEIR